MFIISCEEWKFNPDVQFHLVLVEDSEEDSDLLWKRMTSLKLSLFSFSVIRVNSNKTSGGTGRIKQIQNSTVSGVMPCCYWCCITFQIYIKYWVCTYTFPMLATWFIPDKNLSFKRKLDSVFEALTSVGSGEQPPHCPIVWAPQTVHFISVLLIESITCWAMHGSLVVKSSSSTHGHPMWIPVHVLAAPLPI